MLVYIGRSLTIRPATGIPRLNLKGKTMGNRKTSGLTKRGRIWHLNKQFRGVRIRESAATTTLTKAVELLASRIEAIRQSQFYGVRPMWTFREAAQKYLKENQHKKSVGDDERHLAMLDPYIGDLLLSRVYGDFATVHREAEQGWGEDEDH
jgi:hypothetical protein